MKNGKFEAGDIYALLYKRHSDTREWLCAREVSDQTGWSHRRLDFVACNCYASKGFGIHAYEVKISKSDLRNELFDPTKHNIFFDNIDFFSIVAPDYVLDAEYVKLIPRQWGIVKAVAGKDDSENGKLVTFRKPLALHDEKDYKMSRDFVFSLMRRLRNDPSTKGTEQDLLNAEYARGYNDGKKWVANVDYEKLYREANEKNTVLRRVMSELGVSGLRYASGEMLVEEARKRALVIKKYETAYSTLRVMRHQVAGLEQTVASVKAATAPFTEAAEAVENVEAEPKAEVLDF